MDKLKQVNGFISRDSAFHVDMFKPAIHSALDSSLTIGLQKGALFLNRLNQEKIHTHLLRFKDLFLERFVDREIPLLRALDPEFGIGYRHTIHGSDFSPLLDDLLPCQENQNDPGQQLSPKEVFLLRKLTAYIAEKRSGDLVLDDNDLPYPDRIPDDLPATLAIVFRPWDTKGKALQMISAGGPSAASLIARFCHLDPSIHRLAKEIVIKEEEFHKDVLLAEIVHNPDSRAGNILSRPALRKYEIPYLAASSLADQYRIMPSDLLVSVRNDKVRIRSRRLDKYILPRLTSAHNYLAHGNIPVYQFLCDLQFQDTHAGMSFSWGSLENFFDFLPRVRYRDVILHPAVSVIPVKEIAGLLNGSPKGRRMAIRKWMKKHRLPEIVTYAQGDKELVVNLQNTDCLHALLSIVKNRVVIRLKEHPLAPGFGRVSGNDPAFAGEFIVFFYRKP
jgi:hypothetical protein